MTTPTPEERKLAEEAMKGRMVGFTKKMKDALVEAIALLLATQREKLTKATPSQSNRERAEEAAKDFILPENHLDPTRSASLLLHAITQALDAKDAECKEKVAAVVRATKEVANGDPDWNALALSERPLVVRHFNRGVAWTLQKLEEVAAARSAQEPKKE